MAKRALNGGLNFEGRRQRPLFASKPAPHLETVEQQCFFSWLGSTARLQVEEETAEALRWIHSVPNGAHVAKGHARRLVAEGLTKGILDIACDEPRGGYHGLRIEMKRKGEKPTEEQEAYMWYLRRVGIRAEVCYSWQAAARVVISYFGLTTHSPIYE